LQENVSGILAVHEFHVWQLTGDRIIASAHIRCHNLSEYMKAHFLYNLFTRKTIFPKGFSDDFLGGFRNKFREELAYLGNCSV
jgi:hypothetical protein